MARLSEVLASPAGLSMVASPEGDALMFATMEKPALAKSERAVQRIDCLEGT